MQRSLSAAAIMMLFWISVRFVKYELLANESFASRLLWYSYYLPMIMLLLLMFLSALHVGETDESRVSKKWKLLYIPSGALIFIIMTNDLHQLAFRFQSGFVDWNESYTSGPAYYTTVAFIIFCLVGMLVVVFRMCTTKRFVRGVWLPLIVLAVGSCYYLLYVSVRADRIIWQKMYELPEFTCIFLMAFWESLVLTHLIPANTNHDRFFQASSIHAGMTDNAYYVKLQASLDFTPTARQIQQAEKSPILIGGNDTLLKSTPVRGGHFYWTENISELNMLNRELENTGDYLQEENFILDEAAKLEESRKRTVEQNRLYDQIAKAIKPQLDTLDDIMENLPRDESDFRSAMKYAAVLNAYVKRRSNLLLLAGTKERISSDELGISIKESLDYVSLCSVECFVDADSGHEISADKVLYIYEMFEKIIEESLPDLKAVFVRLRVTGDKAVFYMELASPTEMFDDDLMRDRAGEIYGKLKVETADNIEFITFSFDTGGDEPC